MLPEIENLKNLHEEDYLLLKKISKPENQEVFFCYLDDMVSLQSIKVRRATKFSVYFFSLGEGKKEGQRQEPLGAFSSFISSLMLSREVMGHPRLWAMSPNTESGDNRQTRVEIPGIKIACKRKEKREIQKWLLFLTQVADPHQCALMLVNCPEFFVWCATTDPSHKALPEWFVTSHANKNSTERESPDARLLLSNPCSISRDHPPVLHLVLSRTTATTTIDHSAELSDCPKNYLNFVKHS